MHRKFNKGRRLLACLKHEPPQLTQAEWEDLLAYALLQGCAPLLFQALKERKDNVPAACYARLESLYHRSAFHNLKLFRDLDKLLHAFTQADIPVIVLKGALLARTVYPNQALRLTGDIDLLFKAADFDAVRKVVRTIGYQAAAYTDIASKQCRDPCQEFSGADLTPLDAHWALHKADAPFHVDTEALWQAAVPLPWGGYKAFSLCPADLLIHLCLHAGYSNRFFGLRSLYDIPLLIEHYGAALNWDFFRARVRAWKAEKPVYLVLRLSVNFFNAAVPRNVLDALRPRHFHEKWLHYAEEAALDEHWSTQEKVTGNVLALADTRGFKKKLRHYLRTLFPPAEWLASHYHVPPDSLKLHAYRLLRPAQLMLDYSRAGVYLLSGGGGRVLKLMYWMGRR